MFFLVPWRRTHTFFPDQTKQYKAANIDNIWVKKKKQNKNYTEW